MHILERTGFHLNVKIVALIITIFVGGIVSGFVLLQFTNRNGDVAAQNEKIEITSSIIWLRNYSPYSQAAIQIVNSGNTASRLMEIFVNGTKCEWADVHYWKAQMGSVSSELQPITDFSGTVTINGNEQSFQQATGEIILDAYQLIVLYVANPINITTQYIPEKVNIAVSTEENIYSQEAIVNATTGFMGMEQLTITHLSFMGSDPYTSIAVNLRNTGSTSVTINQVWVNNVQQTSFTPNPATVDANSDASLSVTLSSACISGCTYQIKLVSAKGNQFMYTAVAP